ncbi:uroporphyrinogen-III synthase [Mycoavidus sp. B2-EB]|uniref:uroporphyrinogen-III synthase n=1 Tax=Mycoavidus sp. B2-EB TaxID=2651972 RepID=UPI001E53FFC8|nr:uroporphyrinogen-III synthase [Mycoavidus sp. B2-EB]BBO59714.1 fused uroporphyrinogen-III synthase HemD/membrane protein HemX [Mycoavidus sp. B2-EB]
MTRTAVLTRSRGQSVSLLQTLTTAGMEAFEFPLIELAAAPDNTLLVQVFAALKRFALVIFVSPAAIDFASALWPKPWPASVPIGVVGPGSVRALEQHGITAPLRVIAPSSQDAGQAARYDSEALAAALDQALGLASFSGRTVLIVRGDGGREWLAETLQAHGAQVEIVSAYRRMLPVPTSTQWARLRALLAGESHAWLLTSSQGVRHLDQLAQTHLSETERNALKRSPIVAPHARIAEFAYAAGFVTITQCHACDTSVARALLSSTG